MGRAKGDGSVFWDDDHKCFWAVATYKDPVTGKSKRKWIKGATQNTPKGKSATEKILRKWLDEHNKGILPNADKMTLGEWIDRWLKDYVKPNVRVKSYDKYEGCLLQYVKPKLGSLKLHKIQEPQITALFNELLMTGGKNGTGLSTSTVRATRRYLSMCFSQAVKSKIVSDNPVKLTRAIKLVKAEISVLTEKQAIALTTTALNAAKQADHEYALRSKIAAEKAAKTGQETYVPMFNLLYHSVYMAILLALNTGMRLGEIFGLSWDSVDTEKGIVYVRRSLVTSKAGVNFEEPKTKASRRQIPLSSDVLAELRKYKLKQDWCKNLQGDKWKSSGHVITGEFGQVFNTSNFTSRYFKPLIKQIGLDSSFKFHDLRHTHATLLLLKGIPVKVVSERLGHSTVAMTQDTYAHVLPEMQGEAVKVLEGLFTPSSVK